LLDAASKAGMPTSPEVARTLLQQAGGMALREQNPLGFAEAMLEAHIREYERFGPIGSPVLFDRGLPDVVGFLDVSGLPVSPGIEQACRTMRYHGPILRAPAWSEIYRQDAERIQDLAQAVASDAAVTAAWQRFGYRVIDLPLAPVADRLQFFKATLAL
jgi:predicted ATPase